MVGGNEQPVATRSAGKDHVGAVAKGNLPIFQPQHNGDFGAWLNDLAEPRCYRAAAIDKAICDSARPYRDHILVVRAGHADDVQDFLDIHCAAPCQRSIQTSDHSG